MQPRRVIRPRQQRVPPPHPRMEYYLREAGLYEAATIGAWECDHALFSALVERWRPETHTFHMPWGECTITLQDVAYHLGLRVDGAVVTGCLGDHQRHFGRDLDGFCRDLLGVIPPADACLGKFVKLSWFAQTFTGLTDDSPDETVRQHTRGYIMQLIGKFLLPDKSSSRVHLKWLPLLEDFGRCGRLSWGAAVLATVYRFLCRGTSYHVVDSGGCASLVISWAYHRMPRLRPTGFDRIVFPICSSWVGVPLTSDSDGSRLVQIRRRLDQLTMHDFVWCPYLPHVDAITPDYVRESFRSWTSPCALIAFEIIEWHQPDRVLRQFGGQQHIPQLALNIEGVHGKDGRAVEKKWLPTEHATWILTWDQREQTSIQPSGGDFRHSRQYMEWYTSCARRFLSLDEDDLHDPRQTPVPADLPDVSPPAPILSQPSHVPDRRVRQRRERVGTRSTQRQSQRGRHDMRQTQSTADTAGPSQPPPHDSAGPSQPPPDPARVFYTQLGDDGTDLQADESADWTTGEWMHLSATIDEMLGPVSGDTDAYVPDVSHVEAETQPHQQTDDSTTQAQPHDADLTPPAPRRSTRAIQGVRCRSGTHIHQARRDQHEDDD